MRYATDLPDNEWQILEPLLEPKQKGRPRKHGLRAICNTIRYVQRTGCQWRLLPNDFPPWRVVYMTFWRWREQRVMGTDRNRGKSPGIGDFAGCGCGGARERLGVKVRASYAEQFRVL